MPRRSSAGHLNSDIRIQDSLSENYTLPVYPLQAQVTDAYKSGVASRNDLRKVQVKLSGVLLDKSKDRTVGMFFATAGERSAHRRKAGVSEKTFNVFSGYGEGLRLSMIHGKS